MLRWTLAAHLHVEFLSCTVFLCLTCPGTTTLLFMVAEPFHMPISNAQGPQSLHILSPCYFLFFIFFFFAFLVIAILMGRRGELTVVLSGVSLMTSDIEHLFMCPLDTSWIFICITDKWGLLYSPGPDLNPPLCFVQSETGGDTTVPSLSVGEQKGEHRGQACIFLKKAALHIGGRTPAKWGLWLGHVSLGCLHSWDPGYYEVADVLGPLAWPLLPYSTPVGCHLGCCHLFVQGTWPERQWLRFLVQ